MLTAALLALCFIFGVSLFYEVSSFKHHNVKALEIRRLVRRSSHSKLSLSTSAFSSDSYTFYPIATLKNNNSTNVTYGGYFDAARCMLLDNIPAQPSDAPIRIIKIAGERTLDSIYQRDILMYLKDVCKIPYEKVGDVLFSSNETVVLISINAWTEGQSLPPVPPEWRCKDISLTTVTPSISLKNYYREKPVSAIEQSARVDAVLSAGFGISRTKMSKIAASGKVVVDGRSVGASATVKDGQKISIQGIGRIRIDQVSPTNKGKVKVEMSRIKFPDADLS